jgi:hypothetical protein
MPNQNQEDELLNVATKEALALNNWQLNIPQKK